MTLIACCTEWVENQPEKDNCDPKNVLAKEPKREWCLSVGATSTGVTLLQACCDKGIVDIASWCVWNLHRAHGDW